MQPSGQVFNAYNPYDVKCAHSGSGDEGKRRLDVSEQATHDLWNARVAAVG
jgi:hypothetical protein